MICCCCCCCYLGSFSHTFYTARMYFFVALPSLCAPPPAPVLFCVPGVSWAGHRHVCVPGAAVGGRRSVGSLRGIGLAPPLAGSGGSELLDRTFLSERKLGRSGPRGLGGGSVRVPRLHAGSWGDGCPRQRSGYAGPRALAGWEGGGRPAGRDLQFRKVGTALPAPSSVPRAPSLGARLQDSRTPAPAQLAWT